MSGLTGAEVSHLAQLARIDVTEVERDRFAGQLGVILDAVATVNQVATAEVPPTSHPMPLTNVTRPDVVQPSLTAAQALAGAPESEQGRFRVPRILDEE